MTEGLTHNRYIVFDLILGAITIGLILLSGWSLYSTWGQSLQLSSVSAKSEFLGVNTSPRVSETPGINAWVRSLLNQVAANSEDQGLLTQIIRQGDSNYVPEFLSPVAGVLQNPRSQLETELLDKFDQSFDKENEFSKFRSVGIFSVGDFKLVSTLQKSKQTAPANPGLFCATIAATRMSLDPRQKLDYGTQELGSAHMARIYLLDEFGNFYSLPVSNNLSKTAQQEILSSEVIELKKNKNSPSFASNEFFFRFDFEQPLLDQVNYSGIYLDQGGLGLVATIAVPRVIDQVRCVVAVDVAFDFQWNEKVGDVSPFLTSEVIELEKTQSGEPWKPWGKFLKALGASGNQLKSAVRQLADEELRNSASIERKNVYHETNTQNGNIVAIQIDRNRWLVMADQPGNSPWPWVTISLSGLTLALLIYRIESGRQLANRARRDAAKQLQEKQNLLNTMQVPLMVVDPNSDEIVFCNDAARDIGMKVGGQFGRDVVMDSTAAREQYQKMQTLGEESRRAYGIPIKVQSKDGKIDEKFAIIRSVAVSAPIQALEADQRHRLGILFIINQEFDVMYLLSQKEQQTKSLEKKLLSGLMNHGLESLARMLSESTDAFEGTQPNEILLKWLAHYLSRRVGVVSWLMENWDKKPIALDQRVLNCDSITDTVTKLEMFFQFAAKDRSIRQQLHWNNGILSEPTESAIIDYEIDCPPECFFQIPREGLFGFFLNEVLVNAIKHGVPGSQIQLYVAWDPIRSEFQFKVSNQSRKKNDGQLKPYGGVNILKQICELCGWTLEIVETDNTYGFRWTIDSVTAVAPSQGD